MPLNTEINMHRITTLVLTLLLSLDTLAAQALRPADYFQQEVAYNIDVTLNDKDHTISAFLTLDYTNNSPETLDYIWFHLWPNAYKNNGTAFAKQQFDLGGIRYFYASEKERGYIDSLDFKIDGISLNWEYHPQWIDVAKVHLDAPLEPGATITITTPFFVKLPTDFSRLHHVGRHYEFTQWYPKPAVFDKHGWNIYPYLDMGEFYSEFGTFDVSITLPKDYVIMATGDMPEGDPEYIFLDELATKSNEFYALLTDDGEPDKKARKIWTAEFNSRTFPEPGEGEMKTVHFHQENVHDFAWFADMKWMVQQRSRTLDNGHTVKIWTMFRPSQAELWTDAGEYVADAVYWYSSWYGHYPYNHATAIASAKSSGGAMEYPNITTVAMGGPKEMLEIVVMHEVGHNWHYGIFGYNEREHPWMDEGLNSYSEIRYWDAKYDGKFSIKAASFLFNFMKDPLPFRAYHRLVSGLQVVIKDDQPMETTIEHMAPSNYGAIVYSKSAVTFDYLQHYLGDEINHAAWQLFAGNWSFAHPEPADLQAAFEAASGQDLGWFFEDMIKTRKALDYGVTGVKARNGGTEVTVKNYGELAVPIEVAVLGKGGMVLASKWIDGFTGKTTVEFEGVTGRSATTDPENVAPDYTPGNNHKPIISLPGFSPQLPKFSFIANGPRPDKSQYLIYPALWRNDYNGITPGLIIAQGVFGPWRNASINSLWYDSRHKRLLGTVELMFNRYRVMGIDQINTRMGYSDYDGHNQAKLGVELYFRKPAISTPNFMVALDYVKQSIKDRGRSSSDSFWEGGRFSTKSIDSRYTDNSGHLFKFDFGAKMKWINQSIEYRHGNTAYKSISAMTVIFDHYDVDKNSSTLTLDGNISYRFSRRGSAHVRGWYGQILSGEDEIPAQYKFWLSGGTDADFSSRVGTWSTSSWPFGVYDAMYIPDDGPGLRAKHYETMGSGGFALNFDLTGVLPVDLFADVASSGTDTFIDAGLSLNLGVVRILMPVWVSWTTDEDKFLKNIRLQINL